MSVIRGKCWVFGDDVSTDSILPSKWKTVSFEPAELGKHAMTGLDEMFPKKVSQGDIIVGGLNFGCGSSREQAPLALVGCGIKIIIAKSIARIFYRNCVNVGIYPLELDYPEGFFENSDLLTFDFDSCQVLNLRTSKMLRFKDIPPFLTSILTAGGLKSFMLSGQRYEDLI
ncbi:MAG: 3-isopropylmalate dehydratase [Thermoplasmatales archaeon]